MLSMVDTGKIVGSFQASVQLIPFRVPSPFPWLARNTFWCRSENFENWNSELKTLEWWISGLMLHPLFSLISRLNIACSPLIFNLQINYPIRIKDIPF